MGVTIILHKNMFYNITYLQSLLYTGLRHQNKNNGLRICVTLFFVCAITSLGHFWDTEVKFADLKKFAKSHNSQAPPYFMSSTDRTFLKITTTKNAI